jgi:hypothetical protein
MFAAPTPASAATAPGFTNSEYLTQLIPNDSFDDGLAYGHNNTSGIHILAFDRPADNGTYYGTTGYGDAGFWQNSDIFANVEKWALGWFEGSTNANLIIVVGVANDYDLGRPPACTFDCLPDEANYPGGTNTGTWVLGWYWANWIATLNTYLDSTSYNGNLLSSRLNAAAGMDAEDGGADWDEDFSANTAQWSEGYNSNSGALMFDYGDAALDDGWTDQDVWTISWGGGDNVPAPEIYTQVDSDVYPLPLVADWVAIDQWAYANEHDSGYSIYATVDNYIGGNDNCTTPPEDAWNDMLNGVNDASPPDFSATTILFSTNFTVFCD